MAKSTQDQVMKRVRGCLGLAPTERLVVCCNTGRRGALDASLLKTTGHGPVADPCGGLVAWREAGFPVAGHQACL